MKGYPEQLFAKHFDAPVDRARGLRGAAFQGFLDGCGFLRFQGDAEIVWIYQNASEPVMLDDEVARAILETLSILFPEDQEALTDATEITIRRRYLQQNGNVWDDWLVRHRSRGLTFLMDRYTG